MSTSIKIKVDNPSNALKAIMGRILRKATADLRVVQLEQIAAAFKRGGQPSAKWKPLWADTFQGSVSQKALDSLGKAHTALVKTSAKVAKPVSGNTNIQRDKARLNAIQMRKAIDRLNRAKAKATRATSYRKGGQPLRDTGQLAASFFTKYAFVFEAEGSALIVAASSDPTAPWHQAGFVTKGPNFIPLTLKAKRQHTLGVNPEHEGLEEGVDYIMAWKGVKVPARPMIDYSDPINKQQLDDTVRHALAKG